MDRNVNGIVPVVQTPLKSGEVDSKSLFRHINYLATKKIGGLWVLGTGSEDMHLDMRRRLEVAKVACDANAGRRPLFLGCSFYSLFDTESFLEKTSDLSYDAYHWMPYHPLLGWDRLLLTYEYLAKAAPMWAYSSANWSRSMAPEFVKELKGAGVKGIKFSSQRTSDLQKVIGLQSKEFQVITAVATQFLVCLQMGAKGSTTSLAGVYPDIFIALHKKYQNGEIWEAQKLQDRIAALNAMLSAGKKDNFLAAAAEKEILVRMGIYESPEVTFPYRGLTEDERKSLFQAESRLR